MKVLSSLGIFSFDIVVGRICFDACYSSLIFFLLAATEVVRKKSPFHFAYLCGAMYCFTLLEIFYCLEDFMVFNIYRYGFDRY